MIAHYVMIPLLTYWQHLPLTTDGNIQRIVLLMDRATTLSPMSQTAAAAAAVHSVMRLSPCATRCIIKLVGILAKKLCPVPLWAPTSVPETDVLLHSQAPPRGKLLSHFICKSNTCTHRMHTKGKLYLSRAGFCNISRGKAAQCFTWT